MILNDPEFGEITIRRSPFAKNANFKISTSGRLQLSLPTFISDRKIPKIIENSRTAIRTLPLKDPSTQSARDLKKRLLAKQAKEFLPYRLAFLAKKFGYQYDKHRLSHANTLWGSCTHKKAPFAKKQTTISLNIGLMKLPSALQDYVILHELAHLNHPDHSADFWQEVAKHDPNYKAHRAALKHYHPGV